MEDMVKWKASKLLGTTSRAKSKSTSPTDEHHIAAVLNKGASLVVHVGHGEDHGWADSIQVNGLKSIHNAGRLPIVISAGCSTARFATLPPYEPYEDVNGKKHQGTDAGEVFASPPPPSAYARESYNPTGFGEIMVRQDPTERSPISAATRAASPAG